MKKILFASILAMLMLTGSAFSQGKAITLDQHNYRIAYEDSFHIIGAIVDTTIPFLTGKFSHAAIWCQIDSIADSDSSSVHVILEGAMTSDTTAKWWSAAAYDTLVCSTAVASLPATFFEDFSATLTDMPWARLRMACTNGANDSSRVIIRVYLREN